MAQNFLSAFRGPDRAQIDRAAFSNALLRNQVQRLPQQNRAEDLAIQGSELDLNDAQRKNAAGVLGRGFSIIATSPRTKDTARAFISSPDFQAAGKMLGLPLEQFTVADTDDDGALQQQAAAWAQALSGQTANQNVQSVQVLEDGTIAYVTRDGQIVRTNERARNPLQVIDVAGGKAAFDPRAGTARTISSPEEEAAAAAARKGAEAEAVASVVPAEARATSAAKSPRLAAAVRRLERVSAASQALGAGGGPVEGRFRSMVGTPAAQELEAANAQLINELTALTRIPGVGSQSDLEQRLAQLALPNATQHPSVRARSIQELEAFLTDLGAALDSVASGGQGAPTGGAPQGGPTRIQSDADYERLPSGAQYIAPDGSTRTKR